jgi:hypothetical protein
MKAISPGTLLLELALPERVLGLQAARTMTSAWSRRVQTSHSGGSLSAGSAAFDRGAT